MGTGSPSFHIAVRNNRILHVTVAGFWSSAVMDAFEHEMDVQLRRLRGADGPLACLVDARDYPAQHASIVERHARVQKRYAKDWNSRSAILLPSALARLQAGRVYEREEACVFDSERAAVEWLLVRLAEPLDRGTRVA